MALITDRTHADCEYAEKILARVRAGEDLTKEEKEVYNAGLRGCYNMTTDWVRVESKVAELSAKLGLDLVTKTDWSYESIQTREEIERYLGNIAAICAAVDLPEGAPEVPEIEDWIDYRVANNIEILLEMAEAEI